MVEELEKTCGNCEYENEGMEGIHCRHCIHNAEEHFEPKTCYVKKQEIRNMVIDEFVEKLKPLLNTYADTVRLDEIAEQMKGGAE